MSAIAIECRGSAAAVRKKDEAVPAVDSDAHRHSGRMISTKPLQVQYIRISRYFQGYS